MRNNSTVTEVTNASRAAGRFQLTANAHLSHPNSAAFQRDGQALMEVLTVLGFRPAPPPLPTDDVGSRSRRTG